MAVLLTEIRTCNKIISAGTSSLLCTLMMEPTSTSCHNTSNSLPDSSSTVTRRLLTYKGDKEHTKLRTIAQRKERQKKTISDYASYLLITLMTLPVFCALLDHGNKENKTQRAQGRVCAQWRLKELWKVCTEQHKDRNKKEINVGNTAESVNRKWKIRIQPLENSPFGMGERISKEQVGAAFSATAEVTTT